MSEDKPKYGPMRTLRYVVACPACDAQRELGESDFKATGPEELRLEYQCGNCAEWMLITVTGHSRALKVEKIAVPPVGT